MRYEILLYIKQRTEQGHDVCPKELSDKFGLSQSTISHHLSKLSEEGNIIRNGTRIRAIEQGGLIDIVVNGVSLPEPLIIPSDDPRYIIFDIKTDPDAKKIIEKYLKGKSSGRS